MKLMWPDLLKIQQGIHITVLVPSKKNHISFVLSFRSSWSFQFQVRSCLWDLQ